MKTTFKRLISILLALSMLLAVAGVSVVATEDGAAGTTSAKANISKTATPLDETYRTDVTLAVPGTAKAEPIDVILILGGGMQANMKTVMSAVNVFKPVMELPAEERPVVRLGLISLERGQQVILDLNSDEAILNADTYEALIQEKFDYINTLPTGNTNLHSQLLEAQAMLAAETEAKAENKYVFVLATGRTYWFDNENGEQSVVVLKTPKVKNATGATQNFYAWNDYIYRAIRAGHSSLYLVNAKYNNDWDAYWADVCKWVEADGDKFVYTPGFDETDPAAYANWMSKNNSEWRTLFNGGKGARYGNIIVNPEPTADNFSTGVVDGVPYATNPQYALNYERAQYESAKVYQELVDAGYKCYSICSETAYYQNNSEYIAGIGYTGTSKIQLGHSFMNFLARMGGQTEAPTVWDFERDAEGNLLSTNEVLQENFFESIEADMIKHYCAAGSYVEDYIGYNEETGNFEFIQNPEYLTLKVGGAAYVTSQIETKEGATASYAFAKDADSEPTFWVDYYYGDGKTTEKFIWTFGEDIAEFAPASLTYKLQLTEMVEVAGTYTVETNESAILYPIDSEGIEGEPEVFPVPEVDYTVLPISISGEKTWNDEDNRDGKRPESIIINLYADGELVESKTVTEADGWAWTFDGLREFKNGEEIVYTITETDVDGYEAIVDGYNVTNVHEAEKIVVAGSKTWDDEDDKDGIRPESITINLYADGELVESKTVTEADNWAWSFENLYKYENGEEIVYTITETDVEGYETVVDGYNVTNVHEAEKIVVAGSKTWDDEDDKDGIRPESITINLLANGEVVDTKTVTASDDWAWSFEDLYKYENGEEIVYTITEDAVEGYETVVDGYDVTNVHVPEEPELPEEPEIPEIPEIPETPETPELPEPPVPLVPEVPENDNKVDIDEIKDNEEEIEEPEIPLTDVPETGDADEMGRWMVLAALSAATFAGLSAVAVKAKKREE